MMSKSRINPKYLTNYDPLRKERVRRILYIICTNLIPLSSTQIIRKMDDIFNDESRYTYSTIEKLCPIITRANYRKYLPGLVRYFDATPINETKTQGTPSEVKFEQAFTASQAAKLEYRKAIEKKDRQGKISQDMMKFIETKLDDAEKHHATLLRRTYRYSPNLRTFILYLFNESYVKKAGCSTNPTHPKRTIKGENNRNSTLPEVLAGF